MHLLLDQQSVLQVHTPGVHAPLLALFQEDMFESAEESLGLWLE